MQIAVHLKRVDTKHTAYKLYVCIQVTYHHYNIRRESITIIERKKSKSCREVEGNVRRGQEAVYRCC